MATLTFAEIQSGALDRAAANVSTNAPFTAAEIARHINEAYADVWEASGGSLKRVAHSTAWNDAVTATGTLVGLLTDINEILHVFTTSTAPQTLSCTTASNQTITSSALFGTVTPGMAVTGANIPAGAIVIGVASTSSLTISANASSSTTLNLTFTPLDGTEVERVDLSRINELRSGYGRGTYATPKVCAVSRIATTTAANVNLMRLDYWPSVQSYYFPIHYQPQFTPIASGDTPDLDDYWSRDLMLLAAARFAQLNDRADLVPGIIADISQRGAAALERKLSALVSADQNRS